MSILLERESEGPLIWHYFSTASNATVDRDDASSGHERSRSIKGLISGGFECEGHTNVDSDPLTQDHAPTEARPPQLTRPRGIVFPLPRLTAAHPTRPPRLPRAAALPCRKLARQTLPAT